MSLFKRLLISVVVLMPANSVAMPFGLKGRVQVAQEVNRDQVVAVQGDQETSVNAHLSRKWIWSETINYDFKLSATSSYRYDTSRLGEKNYKISVGINF